MCETVHAAQHTSEGVSLSSLQVQVCVSVCVCVCVGACVLVYVSMVIGKTSVMMSGCKHA